MVCRVTGTGGPDRDRGPNYKGMHVAHIYPLAYAHKVSHAINVT